MLCIFCRLIREDRAHWVARGPRACAFTPLNPLAPGHTLVVPTSHFADLFDTPGEVLAETTALVQRLAKAMRSGLNASGVNVLSASGPGSEQSVPHLHFHVVPRWPEDGISTWPAGQSQHRFAGDPASRIADALAAEARHTSRTRA
ncbi:HIT family protein [Streptomyces nymphaeiformis]|uniref:HIT family protein n=1 Tax=Streptomyces nymphaeiformis TaxID=2663842 RepID=UPI00161AAA70|nr:HIT domain-containing protein [Streptomyces nymphaeiformis]